MLRKILGFVVHRVSAQQGRGFSSSSPSFWDEGGAPLFDKILVANRGEIAVRIMKTARKMGIGTVAVFSDADKGSVHVDLADEKVYLGPSESVKSYLSIDAVLNAMKTSGARAVAPGYGFLSENEHFVSRVEREGYVFIGPPSHAVACMGDKVESKKIARDAGVHTIPGWIGIVDDANHAARIANDIGYPVMIKASGGGGGKGMRIAQDEDDLKRMYNVATDEAASSFGDARMLIEKYIEKPRHVEIQILGDMHGNMVYLPERECSIQRRNQKVIEEAPSPIGTPDLRRRMGEQAVNLAKSVGYYSAGTCEFLVDQDLNFYFLEMNTRLQVEHAITEAVTGLDLVEEMIKISAGIEMNLNQEDICKPKGWAFECRVYAEDPSRGYVPSTGHLKSYKEPTSGSVRVDSGVREGSEINMYYDAMISKVITSGPDRHTALGRAQKALDEYVIRGVKNNLPLLQHVLSMDDFVNGDTSTAFLGHHFPMQEQLDPTMFQLPEKDEAKLAEIALAQYCWKLLLHTQAGTQKVNQWSLHLSSNSGMDVSATIRHAPDTMLYSRASRNRILPALEIESARGISIIEPLSKEEYIAACLGQTHLGNILINGESITFQNIASSPRTIHLQLGGAQRIFEIDPQEISHLISIMPKGSQFDDATQGAVTSPMPGIVVAVSVKEGDMVKQGDQLVVIEAMKMQNQLRASRDGTVAHVHVRAGDTIGADQRLVDFEP